MCTMPALESYLGAVQVAQASYSAVAARGPALSALGSGALPFRQVVPSF